MRTAFVEEHQAERQRGGESVKASKPSAKEAGQEGTRREEREFWERMSSIISDKTFRVWSALEKSLHKYNALLKSRGGLIGEVGDLLSLRCLPSPSLTFSHLPSPSL